MCSSTKHKKKCEPQREPYFLDRITKNHLIPMLIKFEQFPPLRTTEGRGIYFMEQEEYPLISQYLDHGQNLKEREKN